MTRLVLEATVAAPGEVLSDGMVRVTITDIETGKMAGRMNISVRVWELVREWVTVAENTGWMDAAMTQIEIQEIVHNPDTARVPGTMRGKLLEAAQEAVRRKDGTAEGSDKQTGQDEALRQHGRGKGRVSGLFKQVQERRK